MVTKSVKYSLAQQAMFITFLQTNIYQTDVRYYGKEEF